MIQCIAIMPNGACGASIGQMRFKVKGDDFINRHHCLLVRRN